jgi:small-conductance mechanosensitive channel
MDFGYGIAVSPEFHIETDRLLDDSANTSGEVVMICRLFCFLTSFIMLAVATFPLYAAGEVSGTGVAAVSEEDFAMAPVEIDGQVLFRVRGTSSFPAGQRAAAIRERIEAVAADRSIRSDALRLDITENTMTIRAGDQTLMVITDGDARLEHLNHEYLANIHLKRISQAIDDYRGMRSRDVLLRSGLYAGVASVVLIVVIFFLLLLGRRLDSVLSERVKGRIHSVGIQSFEILRAEHIWEAVRGLMYTFRVGAILVVFFAYLHFVLGLFPWTRGIANRLLDLVTGPLAIMGKAIVARIPDLLVLVILFYLFRFALRLLRLFFNAVAEEKVKLAGFDADWALPTYKIVRFMIVAFALIVAHPYIPGSQSAAFKGISLFVGVVFSLGSSSAMANIIAGYMMTYRRAFKVGDRVKVGDVIGDVVATRIQVTHVRSLKNEEVSIPNSQILNGPVVNYSSLARTQGLILHTTVGIGYETPWRQVEAMLILAAKRVPALLSEPRPFILQKELGDFAVSYELNVYCNDPQAMFTLYSELHRQILDVFNEYGVQIMTPSYRQDPSEPKVVPQGHWYAPPAVSEQNTDA